MIGELMAFWAEMYDKNEWIGVAGVRKTNNSRGRHKKASITRLTDRKNNEKYKGNQ